MVAVGMGSGVTVAELQAAAAKAEVAAMEAG